jgi:peptidyl-prolyl cis-trans isomerase B (cyclophilin B)
VLVAGLLVSVSGVSAFAQETTPAPKVKISTKQTKAKKPMHPIATIETTKGTIKIELYPEEAPKAVANFIKLTKEKYYDGLKFHRVVPDFVIQTGDPKGDGTGGPGYTIPDEKNKDLKHTVGAVGMAKSAAPNSAGSQFYIVIGKPAPFLDGGYTVFGKVLSGQDVAEKIIVGDKMTKVTITEPEAKKE